MRPSAPVGLLFGIAAAATAAAQATWTVSAAGGAQFTTLLAAVQAANDGDTILVAP
jgi:hypothetical protein